MSEFRAKFGGSRKPRTTTRTARTSTKVYCKWNDLGVSGIINLNLDSEDASRMYVNSNSYEILGITLRIASSSAFSLGLDRIYERTGHR
jgi:hypothetical protein